MHCGLHWLKKFLRDNRIFDTEAFLKYLIDVEFYQSNSIVWIKVGETLESWTHLKENPIKTIWENFSAPFGKALLCRWTIIWVFWKHFKEKINSCIIFNTFIEFFSEVKPTSTIAL